jgi:hypothetical protein
MKFPNLCVAFPRLREVKREFKEAMREGYVRFSLRVGGVWSPHSQMSDVEG